MEAVRVISCISLTAFRENCYRHSKAQDPHVRLLAGLSLFIVPLRF